jgi:hypothetical protein
MLLLPIMPDKLGLSPVFVAYQVIGWSLSEWTFETFLPHSIAIAVAHFAIWGAIVLKLARATRVQPQQSVGGDSESRAEDGTPSGAPQR